MRDPSVRAELRSLMQEAVRAENDRRQPGPDEMVDTKEAARLSGRSIAALRQAVWRGSIPVHRVGRKLRFRRGDVVGER